MKYGKDVLSLDEPISKDEDEIKTLIDFIPNNEKSIEDYEDDIALKEIIKNSVLELNDEMESKVIILRFGLYDNEFKTLDEVAHILGITREKVCQKEENALRKLRNPIVNCRFKEYH